MNRKIKERCQCIQWNRGIVSIMSTLIIVLFMFSLLALLLFYNNMHLTSILSMTRADAIADGTAVYAQSYDYAYNKPQAEQMASLLTVYNKNSSPGESLQATMTFGIAGDTLTIHCWTTSPNAFQKVSGESLTIGASSTVRSKNIWGDIFVVPGEIGDANHEIPNIEPPPNADIELP